MMNFMIISHITAGIIMCSKSRWYEHDEKSSECFINPEKRNKAKSHVRTLISESGIQVNDPTEIMSKVRDFYTKLCIQRSTKSEKECLDSCECILTERNAGKHLTL